jgi:two-component system LytT family sensor kinase
MIIPKSKSKLITTLIHILIWGVFGMIYFFQPITFNIVVPYQLWIKQFIILSLLVIAYYTNAFILVPKFLLKNRTSIYFLIVICIAVVIILLNIYADQWLNIHQLMDAAFHKSGPPKHRLGRDHGWDLALLAIIALVLGVSTSITAIQKWQADKQLNQELEQDKVTTELSFLKAQINPHFFFNTLNNIYALTQVDADVAGKAIHQLSRMMRYLLYDTQQQAHTLLSQEIAFVKDYISLMQLRLTDVVKVNIDTPQNLQDVPLAPMIFLPFVENAFKHGVSATQQSHIDIVIWQHDKMLDLTVKNSIMNDNSISLDTNSGIGLVNTRRRLDLLYPGKYKLDITEVNANNEYIVHLTLDLS